MEWNLILLFRKLQIINAFVRFQIHAQDTHQNNFHKGRANEIKKRLRSFKVRQKSKFVEMFRKCCCCGCFCKRKTDKKPSLTGIENSNVNSRPLPDVQLLSQLIKTSANQVAPMKDDPIVMPAAATMTVRQHKTTHTHGDRGDTSMSETDLDISAESESASASASGRQSSRRHRSSSRKPGRRVRVRVRSLARSYSTHRLQVSNLPRHVKTIDLAMLFPDASGIRIVQPPKKYSSGLPCALIRFEREVECRHALMGTQTAILEGRHLIVVPKLIGTKEKTYNTRSRNT